MSRFATKITLDELKSKLEKYLGGEEYWEFPYNLPNKIIESDLAKVNFDFENWDVGNASQNYDEYPTDHQGFNGYPCGYEVLENGMPVLFVNAGGDWECPICFCIYWDGKALRGYIPKDGNVYNVKEKCAYGSEESGNFDEDTDIDDKPNGDPVKIRLDVMSRIQIKN